MVALSCSRNVCQTVSPHSSSPRNRNVSITVDLPNGLPCPNIYWTPAVLPRMSSPVCWHISESAQMTLINLHTSNNPVPMNLPFSWGKVVTYILNLLRTIIDFAALRAFAAIRFQPFLKWTWKSLSSTDCTLPRQGCKIIIWTIKNNSVEPDS